MNDHISEMSVAWSSGHSVVIVIDMVLVQNLLAPFCRVFVKDTLRHLPCLLVLASGLKFLSYRYETKKPNKKFETDSNILASSKAS